MKRINFNIKDRKLLTLGLCLVLVCVFALSVAYSALNAVLSIDGHAQVSSSDWDIHLSNPKVKTGSATTNLPIIKTNSTLEFETTLDMPGDYYEFTVDVVNAGSIDAMIENVIKTPELTTEQAKFLKYEVSYQNGESISTKQLLAKDTTMPIKVRIEYRNDLVSSDLPTGQVVLDLTLTLEYIQSDGTGSTVVNNGVYNPVSANGDINGIGTIVTIGSEQFYTIGTEGNSVKLFSMYNLHVGYSYDEDYNATPLESGMQSSIAKGDVGQFPIIGVTAFSSDEQKGVNYSDYNGSIVEGYVNDYKDKLEEFGIVVKEARLITEDELIDSNTFDCNDRCSEKYSWLHSTCYWTGTARDDESLTIVTNVGVGWNYSGNSEVFGVRPVIVISKDYFN